MHIMHDNIVPQSDSFQEDMDLIEILWKQDIDLGVSRDAYDSRPCFEDAKLKDLEISKDNLNDFYLYGDKKSYEQIETAVDPFAGLNYTVDSETGEFLFDDLSGLSEDENPDTHPLENETFVPLNPDTFLPLKDDIQLSNLSDVFPPEEFLDLTPENYTDSQYILSQIEDLEKEFELYKEHENGNETLCSSVGDVFTPNGCWSDSGSLLPFFPAGHPHTSSFSSSSPSMEPTYNSGNLSMPVHSSLPSISNDNLDYLTEILHSASLETPVSDETLQVITSSLEPSSVGCALVESVVALHNETDPVLPSNFINTFYNTNMSDFLYLNQNLSLPSNEMLNHSMFINDAPLMASEKTQRITKEERIDTSSDSASLASGRVPSTPNSPDWLDSCSESSSSQNSESKGCSTLNNSENESSLYPNKNASLYHSTSPPKRFKTIEDDVASRKNSTTFDDYIGNGETYFSIKLEHSDDYESCSNLNPCHETSFRKLDFSNGGPPICSSILQHNHSYHLPFSSDHSRYKPIVRDKSKTMTEDEARNKDEKRAKELNLPISIEDIINLSIDEYNERISKYDLSEQQLHLIRDIRRRGKNKVAAQNCRKRKMDQINSLQKDLDTLYNEKMQLKSKQNLLFQEKQNIDDRYNQLFQIVSQFSDYKPPASSNSLPIQTNGQMTVSSSSTSFMPDDDTDLSRGARIKRKIRK